MLLFSRLESVRNSTNGWISILKVGLGSMVNEKEWKKTHHEMLPKEKKYIKRARLKQRWIWIFGVSKRNLRPNIPKQKYAMRKQ